MKKTIFFSIFILSHFSFSQITYNSSDYAAQNESFLVSHSTSGIVGNDFVQTGANYNWNYSNLIPSSQETLLYQNPNTAGYKNIWCLYNGYIFNCNSQFNTNFSLATKLTNGLQLQGFGLTNVIDHLKLSTTSLLNKMIGSSITLNGTSVPFVASYQTPDVLYQFPINFNDNYTNNNSLSIDLTNLGAPIQYASQGQRTNSVEGWGSLTTPFGTFANVLKMKTTVVNNITITTSGTPLQNTITTISYKWFDPAYGIPVLQVDGNEVASQFIPTDITYFDIQRCLTPTALFASLPFGNDFSTTTNNASVSFVNGSSNYDTLSWDFGDGSASSTIINPTHNYSCPGVKQVTLTITNAFCNPDQVDSITIPVTITDTQNAFTTGVTATGAVLTADRTLTGTLYQWVDCDNNDAPVIGQTLQTFSPTLSGNYAVKLNTNGCESISNCYTIDLLNTASFNLDSGIVLYPNPTSGEFLVRTNSNEIIKNILVYNVLGEYVTDKLDLSSFSDGMYFVKINTENGQIIKKIVKK